MKFIDDLLNSITMYKVVLYGLWAITISGFVYAALGLLPFTAASLVTSLVVILGLCWIFNTLFARLFSVPANIESVWISGLILFLILIPASTTYEFFGVILMCLITIASKYILTWDKVHVFNPVAIALVVMGLVGSDLAIWWAGSTLMLPLVLVVGLLIVRKIKRFQMFLGFLVMSLVMIAFASYRQQLTISDSLWTALISWPLFFFGTVMLTEPLTTPTRHNHQLLYGIIVGVITGSQVHIGNVYSTPELALVVANVFAFLVSNKQKMVITFKSKHAEAANLYDFSFSTPKRLQFEPGQYIEWTFGHDHPDQRGIRRYFTIASSPAEKELHLGVKIASDGSSFKKALLTMEPGQQLIIGQVSGDFVLPENPATKLVFIAGGIGVTPFRSHVQHLIDTQQKRDVVLLYACATDKDFVYQSVFGQGSKSFGLKVHYIASDRERVAKDWSGKVGHIDAKMLRELVPDFNERTFYISGPGAMVTAYTQLLHSLNVPSNQIKTDYFPGF